MNLRLKSFLVVISLAVFTMNQLFSQVIVKETGIPFIQNYTKRDYNGGTQNWDFEQTDQGIMFVANNEGVLVFDGTNWELIPLPNGSVVRSLYKDKDGRIYVGGFNEFGYISDEGNEPRKYHSLASEAGYPETGEIWRIVRQDEFIHFQSYTSILSWDGSTDEWHTISPAGRFGFLLQAGFRLITNQEQSGLHFLQGLNLIPVKGGGFFSGKEVWQVIPLGERLLVCTQNEGVFILESGRVSEWNTPVNDFLQENRFYCSAKNDNYFFWGSILDGMIISNEQGEIIKHIHRGVGLRNNTVLSLFPDREGSLWMGLDNGIAQLHTNLPISELRTNEDIGAGYAAALFEDRIYLGTNQGLFWMENFMNQDPGSELIKIHPVPELTGQVWSLKVVYDELLIGHNLGSFALKNNRVRRISNTPGGWNFIEVPNSNNQIIGGNYYGLDVFRIGEDKIRFHHVIDQFDESSRTLLFESERILWMGHGYQGIFRIELDAATTKALQVTVFADSSGLGTKNFNELLSVHPDVIVSNPEGFYKYDPRINDFAAADRWNESFGSAGSVTRLIRETDERFWYFQNGTAGMLRIINDTLFVRDERMVAPLKGSFIPSFENISIFNSENFLIGTDEGFVHFQPDLPNQYNLDYPILIKSIDLLKNDSVIQLGYQNQYSDTIEIEELAYRYNDFRINFVAPYLTFPDQIQYRYKLEGRSDDWTAWSAQNQAEFFGLKEGDFQIHVQARNVFGTHGTERILAFSIKTPWYRSVLAYATYLVLLVFSVYLSWYFIDKKLEREKRRTKILVKRKALHRQLKLKRDSELAEKELVKLRNDKLRADVRHKSKELANQTMGIIQKNKFLTDMKEEMIQVRKQAQKEEVKSFLNRMIRKIDRNIEDEDTQKIFETNFDQVHENFLQKMRESYPQLTAKDLRLCAYLRLNLSSKEIAPLLNISVRGVEISRYRLRKKLNLDHGEQLSDFILRL